MVKDMSEFTLPAITLTGKDAERFLKEAERRNMDYAGLAEQLISEILTVYYR